MLCVIAASIIDLIIIIIWFVRVHGIGAKLWAEADKQNYGHLHVTFEDGSVGWYEAGWGPMMSEEAYFVKDIVGPKGCVSMIVPSEQHSEEGEVTDSANIDRHTKTNLIQIHHAEVDSTSKQFRKEDEFVDTLDEERFERLGVAQVPRFDEIDHMEVLHQIILERCAC